MDKQFLTTVKQMRQAQKRFFAMPGRVSDNANKQQALAQAESLEKSVDKMIAEMDGKQERLF